MSGCPSWVGPDPSTLPFPALNRSVYLGEAADRFDIVAVGIADERAVVIDVVLRPESRCMQDFRTYRDSRIKECPYGYAVPRVESDMGLAESVAGIHRSDPEVRR